MATGTPTLTIQSGIKSHDKNLTDYALFLGGTNVTHEVLQCYDPLKTGYGRIFMVRKPIWVDKYFAGESGTNKMDKLKHIIEYGNTQIQGLNDVTVNFNQYQGGYVGKSFEIPSYATDDTNSITITVYEFSGSPVREVIHTWINGTTDLLTGFTHYNGVSETTVPRLQSNQTAEFIYVSTDSTGEHVEYACLLANCFPKGINTDAFNYQSGSHELVETAIEFTCTKYESININKVAQALIDKYKLLTNSLNFFSGYTVNTSGTTATDAEKTTAVSAMSGKGYNPYSGKLDASYASKASNSPIDTSVAPSTTA